MWLCPWLVPTSRLVAGSYYRVSVYGHQVPATGPVLVVANHPNMLLDPLIATATAGRPLRFVAKSPLFGVPILGGILRAIGALPVYRRRDASIAAGSNGDALGRIIDALVAGDAVLIFPEGTSADAGNILPFKSGASRILLAAQRRGIQPRVFVAGVWYEHRERPGARAVVRIREIRPTRDLPARPDDRVTTQTLTERLENGVRALVDNTPNRSTLGAPGYRWLGALRPFRFVAIRAPMWLAHRLADRLPVAREERATQHLIIGLGLLGATWLLLGIAGLLIGGWAAGAATVLTFPVCIIAGAACTDAWADDRRDAAPPAPPIEDAVRDSGWTLGRWWERRAAPQDS